MNYLKSPSKHLQIVNCQKSPLKTKTVSQLSYGFSINMLTPVVANFECNNLFNHNLTLLIYVLKAIYVKPVGWQSDGPTPLCAIYFPFSHASQRPAVCWRDNKLNRCLLRGIIQYMPWLRTTGWVLSQTISKTYGAVFILGSLTVIWFWICCGHFRQTCLQYVS